MRAQIVVSDDFEMTKASVIAAMVFPRNPTYRSAYCLRNGWAVRLVSDVNLELSAAEMRQLLELPSRDELRRASNDGTRKGTVAGDLLALIYGQWREGKPEPSMRSALISYRVWSVGKKYGDGEAMKYSDMQLRRYFAEAAPSAHLWAAFRLMKGLRDDKASFERGGLPHLLEAAKAIQGFATTFVPKRTKPAKPVIDRSVILELPDYIRAVEPLLRPL